MALIDTTYKHDYDSYRVIADGIDTKTNLPILLVGGWWHGQGGERYPSWEVMPEAQIKFGYGESYLNAQHAIDAASGLGTSGYQWKLVPGTIRVLKVVKHEYTSVIELILPV